MIEGEADVSQRPYRNCVVYYLYPLLNFAHAQDAALRLVDDGGGKQAAGSAVVGDGEGAALHLGGLELLLARPLGEIVDCAGQPQQVHAVGPFDDGHNQPIVDGRGHADVDLPFELDPLVGPGAVDHGMLLQRLDGGGHDVRREGEISAVAGELGLVGGAVLGYGRKVKLKHGGHVRTGLLAAHHVFGDGATHVGEGHDFAGLG